MKKKKISYQKSFLNKEFKEGGDLETYLTDHYQLISSDLEDQSDEIVTKSNDIFTTISELFNFI